MCEVLHQTYLHTQEAAAVQTLPWALSMHKNIRMFKKLCLFISSSRTGGYNLLGPLLLPEHGNTPTFDYGLYLQYKFAKKSDMSCWHILRHLVMFDIPMILAIHVVKLSYPPLPAYLSATTMLATIGYGCFMKPSSTSRHELTF